MLGRGKRKHGKPTHAVDYYMDRQIDNLMDDATLACLEHDINTLIHLSVVDSQQVQAAHQIREYFDCFGGLIRNKTIHVR